LLDHRGRRPRRGAQARPRGVEALQPEDRGAAVPVSVVHVREAADEAFATAVGRWPADGVPPSPGAWLTTTPTRRAIDRIRRENKRGDKREGAQLLYDGDPPEPL